MSENSNDERLKLQQAYKRKLGGDDEDARLIMEDLESKFYINHSTHSVGISGVDLSGREGMRDVVLYIKDWLRGDLKDKVKDLADINKHAEEEHKI